MATGAFTGIKLGTAVLWAVVLGAVLKYTLNEGLARWQLATGETILEGAVTRLGRPVQVVFLPYLLLWTFFVGSALISACGVAMHAMVPVFAEPVMGKRVFGVVHSLVGVALVLVGGFGGTLTMLCYGYWIREKGRTGEGALGETRLDLGVAYVVTALFGMAMVTIGSTIPAQGKGALLIVHLADKLQEPLGVWGKWAFLVGAWSAIFSSLLGVWQSVPYVFADYCRLVKVRHNAAAGRPEPPEVSTSGWTYRGYLAAIATVPMTGLFVNFRQVEKIYAVFGALFMPVLAVALLLLCGREDWIGPRLRNRRGVTAFLVAAVMLFLYFGFLRIRKKFGF